jgi:aspartyl-tRNA(Asn)/glutamyl-tRNA(Gln) amidotransferase subunit A
MTDPSLLTVHEAAAAIAARKLSPVDLVEALLARIARLEPKLHAYTEVYAEDARLAAKAAESAIRAGHALGPLHGIPIALKDLIEIEGRVHTGGSALFRDRRGTQTATIVRRLVGAGMILLGKTHTVEFAFGGWGTNAHLGTPWNPWDAEVPRTPGGSSSGSGVAVGACLAPWAIGTDTGGSVRLPAALNGITGLKVTIGRVSAHGIQPLSTTLDTPGPMTRSVRDAALLFDALQGPDPLDPNTRGVLTDDPLRMLTRGVRGLRLGRITAGERAGVSAAVLAAYDASLEVLARLGAELVDFTPPQPFLDYATGFSITNAEAYALYGALAEDAGLTIDPAVRKRLLSGAALTARDYLAARARREAMRTDWAARFGDIDALLTPTVHTTAIPLDEVDQDVLPSRFTRFVNLMDLCALSVPNGADTSGLPTGLHIVCRGYEEAMALRIGHAFESATSWQRRLPPMVTETAR